MDEALVLCAVDLCGRPYFVMDFENGKEGFGTPAVGAFDTQLVREFFYSVSYAAAMNLHFRILAGENDHHIIEAMFKALGRALKQAVAIDPTCPDAIPSTKGSL
jgi:imidazoleglycerol-phosphate dehydratase